MATFQCKNYLLLNGTGKYSRVKSQQGRHFNRIYNVILLKNLNFGIS